jgi:hypothetical protein
MFRIDDPTAAAALPDPEAAGTEAYFTEGNPGVTPATLVRASWLNMIQEELRAIVIAAGLTPSKTTYNQVLSALNASYAKLAGLSTQAFSVATATATAHATPLGEFAGLNSANGYIKLPMIVAGVKKTLILQWGSLSTSASAETAVTFPIAFPTLCAAVTASWNGTPLGSQKVATPAAVTSTGFSAGGWDSGSRSAILIGWIAVGY